ncbi:hypothetical protein D9M69_707890 [compost metagenome]
MLAQAGIGDIADIKCRHTAKGRAAQLRAHVAFAIIGCDEEEMLAGGLVGTERQIQHAHDAGIDRGGMFDFKGGFDLEGGGV